VRNFHIRGIVYEPIKRSVAAGNDYFVAQGKSGDKSRGVVLRKIVIDDFFARKIFFDVFGFGFARSVSRFRIV
jgi:hypothetical protein